MLRKSTPEDERPFSLQNRQSKSVTNLNKKRIAFIKPCELYGLDPSKLEIDHLLKNRTYRRLYNIISNDETSSQYKFRPNLIKELYFLLQITPFIQDQLQQSFLTKIEELYNSNDHKKIKLSKNLDGMVKTALSNKQKENSNVFKVGKRPKSSIQWDTTLNPFLRPYTAKLKNKTPQGSVHQSVSRPTSSKNGRSTNAYTNCPDQGNLNMQAEYNQQKTLNNDLDRKWEDVDQICDIEQEWERSLDFKKKHRTLHPEEEPTYEKLMGLIMNLKGKKIETVYRSNTSLEGKDRKMQQAGKAEEIRNAKQLAQKEIKDENEICGNDQQQSMNEEEYKQDEEIFEDFDSPEVDYNQKKRSFNSDKRSKGGRRIYRSKQDRMYVMLNGVKILRPFTAKQSHIINKLDQYSAFDQNRKILQSNFDEQCAVKYKSYVRHKNLIKREINRKSQAKRYMDNFMNIVKVIPSRKGGPSKIIEIERDIQSQQQRSDDNSKMVFLKGGNHDLQKIIGENQKENQPFYNVRQFFQRKQQSKVASSSRGIHTIKFQNNSKSGIANPLQKMTYNARTLSEKRFDPLHIKNVEKYNKEALMQIQAIKQRFGGKACASTEALMKALYVDIEEHQEKRMEIPDKRYLMIRGEKEGKKRKLKKKSSKQVVTK